ncbi:segregation/condensation protein A [Oscillospiraceae bacterium MB08-C2-2]|nr:segregation/condensation protein A [Oscillospiraceae bacterium MB08-C2-2]
MPGPMEELQFRVAEFEGPLDLLLVLITRHKMDIFNIEISALLAQYLAAIEQMKEQDLDVASEFLEMASRLVYMKTVSLLPRHEEENQRLQQELTGQLLELRLCKAVARLLGERNLASDLFVREPMPLPVDQTYTLVHPRGVLFDAYADAVGREARRRPPPEETFRPLVAHPMVSVTSKIFTVLRALRRREKVPMGELFEKSGGRSGMVATFLALLELVHSQRIVVREGEVLSKPRRR